MFRNILFAAVLSGVLAGIAFTGLQAFKVLPLIWQAEVYETSDGGTAPHAHPAPGRAVESHEEEAAWAPADGIERIAFTALANVLVGVGFALLLCGGFALKGDVDWRKGLVWGLLGYTAFQLAPAFGLPPELPGMRAADLGLRQLWWAFAAASTAGGLAAIFLSPSVIWRVLGAGLVVLPHAVGAPHPQVDGAGALPAELAAAFVSATLVTNLLFWLLLGALSAATFRRFAEA